MANPSSQATPSPTPQPSAPDLHRHARLIVAIFSLGLIGGFFLMAWGLGASFSGGTTASISISIAVAALGIGFVSSIFMKKAATSDTAFLWGGHLASLVSVLPPIQTYLIINALRYKTKLIQMQYESPDSMGSFDLFGPIPPVFLVGLIIIVFYNIPFYGTYHRPENKLRTTLRIYGLGLGIYILTYIVLSYLITPLLV